MTAGGRAADDELGRQHVRRIRRRHDSIEIERLELLADERVPGREHRLDAPAAARRDLVSDLDGPSLV